jgi:hypothetical protein
MDAWKSVGYSGLSPIFALSYTTEQWGFQPFPSNLVAIPGYLKDVASWNNTVLQAWNLPDNCSTGVLEDHTSNNTNYYYPYPDYYIYIEYSDDEDGEDDENDKQILADSRFWNGTNEISSPSDICTSIQSCASSECLILIEGIGRTTTGPAKSSIVALSHGVSFLLSISLTVAIMGCFSSRFKVPQPVQQQLHPDSLNGLYNPPPDGRRRQERRLAESSDPINQRAINNENLSGEIARCSDLFRQMYKLDLEIWGMKDVVPSDIPKREKKKLQSNALFNEIQTMVHGWVTIPEFGWSPQQRNEIREICRVVDQYDSRRYPVALPPAP